jgi:ribonuclease Y
MTVVLVVALVVVAAIAVGASVLTVMSLRRGSGVVNSAPAGPSLESTHLEVAELRSRAEADAAETRRRAQEQADLLDEARHAHEAEVQALKAELRELRSDLERREHRLAEREARIDESQRRVEFRDRELVALDAQIARHRAELEDVAEERRLVLERTAGLTAEAAKAELVSAMENQAKREAAIVVRDIERVAREDGDRRARDIVTLAIQRVASEQTAESVVSVLHLPSDEMKGRIIGREGRNIRAFETVTGVNVTLDKLVLDGRIHPHRIEEIYERSVAEVDQICIRAGEDALVEVGITSMHPELVNTLGKLRYRTSYGQNVLKHLIESAHLAGIMASELRLDVALMKRCALLHDIGKALTHEVEGSHAIIGAELARKYGEIEDVVHAIEAHHNEVEVRTIEAVLTQAADAISGGRPGARRESLESYVQRLERLEAIANSYEGVEKVYAMQAGREVRVMVLPDQIDDIQAQVIARDIAKQIEEELTYPGQIRVTVVRESRATELAH